MHLVICVGCAHPAPEHGPFGCSEVADLVDDDDGETVWCACNRTETEVYQQHVPPAGEHAPANEARADDREPSA